MTDLIEFIVEFALAGVVAVGIERLGGWIGGHPAAALCGRAAVGYPPPPIGGDAASVRARPAMRRCLSAAERLAAGWSGV